MWYEKGAGPGPTAQAGCGRAWHTGRLRTRPAGASTSRIAEEARRVASCSGVRPHARKAVQQLERNEAVGIRLDVPTEEEVFLQVGRGEVVLDLPTRGLHPRRRE